MENKDPTFEDAMERLTAIVEKLESGTGTLEEMIRLYEQGVTLVNGCTKRLDGYEATVTKLSAVSEEA